MSILSNVFSVRFAAVAVSALLLSASALASSCGTDISAQFTGKVNSSPKAPEPFTNKMISLTNDGSNLPGAVYLAIYNVPSGIGLQEFTWTSSCDSLPAGTYFIRIYLGYDKYGRPARQTSWSSLSSTRTIFRSRSTSPWSKATS